jgi:hypothetical protein
MKIGIIAESVLIGAVLGVGVLLGVGLQKLIEHRPERGI